MAVLELNAMSTALSGSFSATVIMPGNAAMAAGTKSYPALYFLHDIGGNDTDILTVKGLEALADELGLFIIAPSVMHSFGLDLPWGGKYGEFVYKELPGIYRHMFPLDEARQYIGGVGGGAYGAYMNAAKHHDVFKKCLALNGRYDVAALCEAAANGITIPNMRLPNLEAIFGEPMKVRGSKFDILQDGHAKPADIYIGCEEDFAAFNDSADLARRLKTATHTAKDEAELYAAALRSL